MTQPTFINLHPNEYSQKLHFYTFSLNLDRCVGSCNTFIEFSSKVCAPNKTENLNLSLFNIVTEINKSKTLTNHISPEYKYKFDGKKCNSNQKWNNYKCWCDKCQKSVISVDNDKCQNRKKFTVCATKVIFGTLLLLLMKVVNI